MLSKFFSIRYFSTVFGLCHGFFAMVKTADEYDKKDIKCNYQFNIRWDLNQQGLVSCATSKMDYTHDHDAFYACKPESCTFRKQTLKSDPGLVRLDYQNCNVMTQNGAIPNPGGYQNVPDAYGYEAVIPEAGRSVVIYRGDGTSRSERFSCKAEEIPYNKALATCGRCKKA